MAGYSDATLWNMNTNQSYDFGEIGFDTAGAWKNNFYFWNGKESALYCATIPASGSGNLSIRRLVSSEDILSTDGYTFGRYGYQGYQSFVSGEVTPGEAHVIGIETARRMWGKDYEIVVTTHLNTDNLHNHIVVNSVSFRTGRKFENHISDHYKLREISDEVCREYGKSVLAPSKFKGNRKKDYWIHKSGGFTHRDILKRDIDEAISKTTNGNAFELYLKSLGYSYARNSDYHPSIIAPGWKRPVRIDSLGEQYTQEKIRERLISNQQDITLYALRIPKRHTPLLQLEYEFKKAQRMDGMQLAFALIIELWKLITGNNVELSSPKPLSPMLRKEVRKLDQTLKEYT